MDGSTRLRALEAARLIADRVSEPKAVASSLQLAREQTRFPLSVHWDPVSIAQGDAGQALLTSHLNRVFPNEGWDLIARNHLDRAVHYYWQSSARESGLIGGLAGLAYTTRHLGEDRRYEHLLNDLDGTIAQASLSVAAQLSGRSGVAVSSFDLISGLSGTVLAMLPADGQRGAPPALQFLVRALCGLALANDDLPAWHTPPGLLYDDDYRRVYPHGNLNLGLAHGVPGILAALSVAHIAGHRQVSLDVAIRSLAESVVGFACGTVETPTWPTAVSLKPRAGRLVPSQEFDHGRDAWCYGTPGVARALYLAGTALGERNWQELAIAAMRGVYARSVPERAIDSPTFCHGVAGLLQISLRFAHDTAAPVFDEAVVELTQQILAAVDTERPMAIANLEPGDNLVDQPGLLDGATGVCLVLLSAATDVEPTWDRVFGLA